MRVVGDPPGGTDPDRPHDGDGVDAGRALGSTGHDALPSALTAAAHPYVAVVGSGDAGARDLAAAEAVGRLLAEAGAVVVCGGRGGVMEAACRGAAEAGGLTVGIVPGDSRQDANPWVAVAVATGMGEMRNGLVIRSADVVLAIGGEYGTLSEIALALKIGRPVVGLRSFSVVRPDDTPDTGVVPARDPEDAVSRALALVPVR